MVLLVGALALAGCGSGGGEGGLRVRPITLSVPEDGTGVASIVVENPRGGLGVTYSLTRTPVHGRVLFSTSASTVTYIPNAEYAGPDSFAFHVTQGARRATVEVPVTVSSVLDAPRIDLPLEYLEVADGRAVTIPAPVDDAEGDAFSVNVQQLAGPAVTDLRWQDGLLQFNTPALPATSVLDYDATPGLTLRLRVTATDATNRVTVVDRDVRVLRGSASGRLLTVRGSPEQPGHHWIIVAEGYTAAEYSRFRTDVEESLDWVIDEQPFDRLSAAWNVHVLWVPSAESGVDDASAGIELDTAWDGGMGCMDWLPCVDYNSIIAAGVDELPWYDHMTTLFNTDHGGGWAFDQFAVVAGRGVIPGLGSTFGGIMRHEVGHAMAKLADEYEGDNPPLTMSATDEARYRNITSQTTPGQVKWRHWFAEPDSHAGLPGPNGIGLFEGAWYHREGVWRPSLAGFMRDAFSGTKDAVAVEAWTIQLYRRSGAVVASDPPHTDLADEVLVQVPAGSSQRFRVRTLFAAPHVALRWTVDGVEPPGSAGARALDVIAGGPGVERLVEVHSEDATGLIADPAFDGARQTVAWRLRGQ
jgi:hypothetical protein